MSKKKGKNAQQQIAELRVKRRAGLIKVIAAIAGLTALIIVKQNLMMAGVEWASSEPANLGIFLAAVVAAGFAGYGSRDWRRAGQKKDQLQGSQGKR